jgi:orotidine-5'-phosphate decarboxylase
MNSRSDPRDKIIVALDVPAKADAHDLVKRLTPEISFFKIGLQLYTVAGPEVVHEILETGAKVFLDLKLHDIPNTVARAVESAASLGVQMLTIHLSGGEAMLRAAVSARPANLLILGVTVLTSLNEEALHQVGVSERINDHVLRLARLGREAGIDGLVASPFEARTLREEFGDNIKIVTPGVRPSWSEAGDQERFMTPRQAFDAGADYLVIGRPITAHANPREAVVKILDELEG